MSPPWPVPPSRCEIDIYSRENATDAIVQALLSTPAQRPRLLGVDGRSGSGKTHLAADIADALRCRRTNVVMVSMDDLYPGWEGLAASLPTLCERIITPLSHGKPGTYRRYSWEQGALAETVDVPLADVVIIEGVGSSAHSCRRLLTVTVWVQASIGVRLSRACDREGQGDFAVYADRWSEQEDALFGADTYPDAPPGYDFVVSTESVLVNG